MAQDQMEKLKGQVAAIIFQRELDGDITSEGGHALRKETAAMSKDRLEKFVQRNRRWLSY